MSCVRSWLSNGLKLAVIIPLFIGATGFNTIDLVITERRELRFGNLERQNTVRIGYNDANSGEFVVEGRAGRKVRLTIEAIDLLNPKNSSHGQLHIELANSQCAFSLDGGRTWQPFSTGPLFHDTRFPSAPPGSHVSSIVVRVGGTVTTTRTQERGPYSGNVRLTASYTTGSEGMANCTYTHGYWKNHTESWPTGYSSNAGWIANGAVTWRDMLAMRSRGNANTILAHQYIAAVLNLAHGADGMTNVVAEGGRTMTIQDIVDACTAHYYNTHGLSDQLLLEYARILDDYNNGRIGPGHCD